MSNPPPGDRYDWLYDDPKDAGPADAPASSGSELPPPQLPPPSGRGGSRGGGSGGGRPGGPSAPSAAGRKPRRRRRAVRIVLVLVLVWLVFCAAVPFWAWGKITKVDATPSGSRPASQPGTTILLVGSDKRTSWTQRGRTDTIMLLHWGSGPTVLTSIPRDSQVPIPGHGTNKINAAYSWGGAKLLVQTVEQNTGVRVDGYVEIGFTGLVDVVNAVGGITLCPKTALNDADAHLSIKAGCQKVNGSKALAYSRARHSRANGDIGRAEAQREVIGAIGSSVRSPWTFINPIRYTRVAGSSANALTVNKGMSLFTFGMFAWKLSGAMSGNGLSCTVPLANLSVKWDRTRALEFFAHIKNDTSSELGGLCTSDGFAK